MVTKAGRPLPVGRRKTTSEKAAAAELRADRSKRIVSLSEFQTLTGFDRGTVSKWLAKGCPDEGKGPKGAIQVDIRAVMLWREEQARIEGRKEASSEDGSSVDDPEIELKRKQLVAMNLKIAKDAGVAVNMHAILASNAIMLNAFRSSLEGLPDRLERDWVGFPKDIVRKSKADSLEHCRATLSSAQRSMERAFRTLTKDRLGDVGVDPDEDFDADDADDLDVIPGEEDVMEALDGSEDI